MTIQAHSAVSCIVALGIYGVSRSTAAALASLITGILTDLDHIIDYCLTHGLSFNIPHFFKSFSSGHYKHIFLLFHGWEHLAVLAVAAWLLNWNPWLLGLTIGYAQHLAGDQLFNPGAPLKYSIVWRWKNGFLFSRLFAVKTT